MPDSTKLFSDRVNEYVKSRPGYPPEILDVLAKNCGLTSKWRIADLGCGPGNLTRLFLKNGNAVYGVEPNTEMRQAAERFFDQNRYFRSVDGKAEATTLPDASVEMVVAGQAFHWFDPIPAKIECKRILVPGGWAALVWNVRRHDASRFMERYEWILNEILPAYRSSKAKSHGEDDVAYFFGGARPSQTTFEHFVEHGWESFSQLVLSTSYAPKMGQPGHHALMEALRDMFDKEQVGGKVRVMYKTQLFYGQLK